MTSPALLSALVSCSSRGLSSPSTRSPTSSRAVAGCLTRPTLPPTCKAASKIAKPRLSLEGAICSRLLPLLSVSEDTWRKHRIIWEKLKFNRVDISCSCFVTWRESWGKYSFGTNLPELAFFTVVVLSPGERGGGRRLCRGQRSSEPPKLSPIRSNKQTKKKSWTK